MIGMKEKLDLEALLDQTFFCIDILSMLGDLEDFIEFSESNIGWQKHRELRRAECDCDKFDNSNDESQYRYQTIEGVKYRFDVSLTQRVRYATLTALITTVEWVLLELKRRASFKIPNAPKKVSEAVHILKEFNEKASLGLEQKIQFLGGLIHTRNCIVHSAGLLTSYRHEVDLRQWLSETSGLNVSEINLLGESIEIEPGFLEAIIRDINYYGRFSIRRIFRVCFCANYLDLDGNYIGVLGY